jgi:DNA uptake protein ComE-like DNA-binding protein
LHFEYSPGSDSIKVLKSVYQDAEIIEYPDKIVSIKPAGQLEPYILSPRGKASKKAVASVPTLKTPGFDLKLDINTASSKEIEESFKGEGIGPAKAKEIVDARSALKKKNKVGFTSMKELMEKCDPAVYKIIKERVALSEGSLKDIEAAKANLAARKEAFLKRAKLMGVSIRGNVRKINPNSLSNSNSLVIYEKMLASAEEKFGGMMDDASGNAIKEFEATNGKDSIQKMLTGKLEKLTTKSAGDLLAAVKNTKFANLLDKSLVRSLLYLDQAGIDIKEMFSFIGKNHISSREFRFALESFENMMDSGLKGSDTVLKEMVASSKKWQGGIKVIKLAKYGFGFDKVDGFEMPINVAGKERIFDIVLKNGLRVESKEWNTWNSELEMSLVKQFLNMVRLSLYRPTMFLDQMYVFPEPPPKSIAEIRWVLRTALENHLNSLEMEHNDFFVKSRINKEQILDNFGRTDFIKSSISLGRIEDMPKVSPKDPPDLPNIYPLMIGNIIEFETQKEKDAEKSTGNLLPAH